MGVSGVHRGPKGGLRVVGGSGRPRRNAVRERHPGGRPGGGSPSPARLRRRSCSSPWRGRRSPEAAPGAQLRPGAPRHASRRAPGEGAAWPRTARRWRRLLGRRQVLRRRRDSGQAPATSPGGGGGGCVAPAPLLLLQLLPSGKGRAAAATAPPPVPRLPPPASRAQSLSRSLSRAAASSAPLASPIRLPAPSAAPRGRPGGCGQNEAGPFSARRSLRGAEPI